MLFVRTSRLLGQFLIFMNRILNLEVIKCSTNVLTSLN